MVLHLSGEVNDEMFNKLVNAVNNLKAKDKLNVYFRTQGGETDVAEAMIDFINQNKEQIAITFYGEVFSSGMIIFLKATCSRYILPETRGMFHFSWQEMTISEGGKPSHDYDKFCLKEMKKSMNKTIEFLKTTKLTPKEIRDIARGKDVYFSHERMIELL